MTKRIVMVAFLIGATSGIAAADAKVDAQAPVKADNAPGGNRCRALDVGDQKLILEVEDKSPIRCSSVLMTALRKHWCSAANKGKKFDYISDFDHMIGTGRFAKRMKSRRTSLTCFTVAK